MTLKDYAAATSQGITLLEEASAMSITELTSLFTPTRARELKKLAAAYFGETPYTKKRAKALASSHDLHTIERIERYVARVKKQLDKWRLRAELAVTPAADITSVALARIRELQPPKEPEHGIKVIKGRYAWRLIITGTSTQIQTLAHDQDGTVARFVEKYLEGNPKPTYTVNVNIELGDLERFLDGFPDGTGDETVFYCTDGTTITGTQLMNAQLAERGYAALIHPVYGPVELGTFARFSSFKQTKLTHCENPVCAWPDCREPAVNCQTHHAEAVKHGGRTDIQNLLPLCAYHNGINDDLAASTGVPSPNSRGWMSKIGGKTHWNSPFGGPPISTFPGYRAPMLV